MDEVLSNDSADSVTLGTMLVRLATELDAAAATAAELQSVLSPILAQSDSHMTSQKIQGLDLLEQTLRDLAAVLGDMAATPGPSHLLQRSHVLGRCKLAAVAHRLSGEKSEAHGDDIELF